MFVSGSSMRKRRTPGPGNRPGDVILKSSVTRLTIYSGSNLKIMRNSRNTRYKDYNRRSESFRAFPFYMIPKPLPFTYSLYASTIKTIITMFHPFNS